MVSSNGTQNGIVWALVSDLYNSNGSSILYAFNATNVAQQLYASNQNSSRDDAGRGHQVHGSRDHQREGLCGCGLPGRRLRPSERRAASAGACHFPRRRDLQRCATSYHHGYSKRRHDLLHNRWVDSDRRRSTKYTGAFQLSTDATVQAIASASGYLQSAVASATYNFNTQTPMPQFSPAAGTYTTTQSVTISDSTSGAVIYYTTNGSTPTTGFDEIYRDPSLSAAAPSSTRSLPIAG